MNKAFLYIYIYIAIPFRSTFESNCTVFYDQDMVLLHHEVEVDFPDGRPAENHRATLLEFGSTKNGKTTNAMAFTVGIPAAIGALVSTCYSSMYFCTNISIIT